MGNFIFSLLQTEAEAIEQMKKVINTITQIASAATGLVTVAVVGFAIYLAFKFFTASDEEKRKNAKAQLVYAVLGVVVLVVVMILIPVIKTAIENSINSTSTNGNGQQQQQQQQQQPTFHVYFPKYWRNN